MKKATKQPKKHSSPYSKINFILVLLFILLLPTQLGKHFFLPFSYLSGVRVDYLAPTMYLTDILVFLLTLINLHFVIKIFKQKHIFVFFFILAFTLLFAQSFPIALYRYAKVVEIFIVGVIAYKHIIGEKMLLIVFLIGGLFQLVLTLIQLVAKHSVQGFFYLFGERYMSLSMPGIAKASLQGVEFLRPYGTFSHPNSLGGFFLVLYTWILVDKRFKAFSLLKYGSLFIFSLLVFVSFSKVAIATYLLLNFYYLLFKMKLSCQFCKWARFIILAIVGAIFMQARTDPLTVQKRWELINNSVKIVLHHPLTGVGLGNYLVAQNQYVSKLSFFFNQPVHNIFLLVIAELGIPVSLFIFYLIFSYSKKFSASSLLILTVIIITGFFDHYWLTLQQNMLLLGFIIGRGIFLPVR